MRKNILKTLLIVFLLLLTACASAAPIPSVDQIVSQTQTALNMPIHGIMEVTNQAPYAKEIKDVMEIWQNGPEKFRTITLEGSEGTVGNMNLFNGNEIWYYNASQNTYSHTELSDEASTEVTNQGMTQMVEQMLESMDIAYLGSEEVAERQTYKLKFSPKEGVDRTLFPSSTISVDSETWYPLKIETANEGFETKMQFREIEFNPDFPPDTFSFVPPEGASEHKMNMPELEELTLEEVRQRAPFKLLEPTYLPEGFEFKSVELFEMPEGEEIRGISVTLNYQNDEEELMISEFYFLEGLALYSEMEKDGKKVTVHGQEGHLMYPGMGMHNLIWLEDNLQLGIFGTLSEEETLKVAESLE